VQDAIERYHKCYPSQTAKISIISLPSQHIGLGIKTSLILVILKAIGLINNFRLTPEILQKLSSRGGTSGIGIHSFFYGGCIIDGGHYQDNLNVYLPSSQQLPSNLPPVISHLKIPKKWHFILLLPQGKRISGKDEIVFFKKNTPLHKEEVIQTLSIVYHGVAASVAKSDLELLKKSLLAIHRIGFKKRELDNQTRLVRNLFDEISQLSNCAVGLSSLGPLIYVVVEESLNKHLEILDNIASRYNTSILGTFKGRNKGYKKVL